MTINSTQLKEKIDRWKRAADMFQEQNIPVFVKEMNGFFYFGNVLEVGDEVLLLELSEPENLKGKHTKLYWVLIDKFEPYDPHRGEEE